MKKNNNTALPDQLSAEQTRKLLQAKLTQMMETKTTDISLWEEITNLIQPPALSPEDEAILSRHCRRAEELMETALCFITDGGPDRFRARTPLQEEVASGADSYFHRGWYCPSPVYDQLVGNCHRGKLLKRVTARSKITNRYLFDEGGLYLAETHWGTDYGARSGSSTEFLLRSESSVIGITVDSRGLLKELSEEIYADGVIRSYFTAYCPAVGGHSQLSSGKYETYIYDEQGLLECELQDIKFGNAYIRRNRYCFIREGGYLKGYFEPSKPNIVYEPGKKRLSKPPFLL